MTDSDMTPEDYAEIGAALVTLVTISQMLGHDDPSGSVRYVTQEHAVDGQLWQSQYVLDAIGACIAGSEGDPYRARLAASADSGVKKKIASAVMR